MLPHALIPNGNGDEGRAPVANESLRASIEDWLAAHSFGACAIDLCKATVNILLKFCSIHSQGLPTRESLKRIVQ